MSRSLKINGADQVVRDVAKIIVAKDGTTHGVTRALVACDGITREFWPAVVDPTDPDESILWPTDEITTTVVVQDPTDAAAFFTFDLMTGEYTWSRYPPTSSRTGVWVNPAPSGTGQYVMRCDQTGGDVLSGEPLGSWLPVDPLSGFISWGFLQAVPGKMTATGTITIAPDAGGGTPDVSKQVARPCNWYAEVVGEDTSTDIVWSEVPWMVEEITVNELADCTFAVFAPYVIGAPQDDGRCIADGDTSGFIQEPYSLAPDGTETVFVNVFSGTPPDGPLFDVEHVIANSLVWTLSASNENDDLTCELDVTIAHAGNGQSQTKRVTLHSARTDDGLSDELVWPDGQDPVGIFDIGVGTDSSVVVRVKTGGFTEGIGLNTGENTPWPIDWHSESPNTTTFASYEVSLTFTGDGPNTQGSAPVNEFLPIIGDYEWQMGIIFDPVQNQVLTGSWTLTYRAIGQPSTELSQVINVQCNTEGLPGGEPLRVSNRTYNP